MVRKIYLPLIALLFLTLPAAAEELFADQVVVLKADRKLQLLRKGQELRSYKISLGSTPVGHKEIEGDGRTPEGTYFIDWRNDRSRYFRSLHISYPNAADIERARKAGASPGGDIMIHGLPNGLGWLGARHLNSDWTAGCIAVTNDEIAEIWRLVPDGAPIEIKP